MTSQFFQVNGINLHVVEDGPQNGKVLLFLHGFPEFWYAWKKYIPFFSGKGFKCLAPDQRGYNLSDKPHAAGLYKMQILVEDIAALIRSRGEGKVCLVGHDWGGVVAWNLGLLYPELLEKVIILNMPHPGVLASALSKSFRQKWIMSYAYMARFSWLTAQLIKLSAYQILSMGMKKTSRPNTFSKADLEEYRRSWKMKGSLKAMLNWYTANFCKELGLPEKIETPLLLVWGKDQKFFPVKLAEASIGKCTNGSLCLIPDGTHWVHHEQHEKLTKLILDFLKEPVS